MTTSERTTAPYVAGHYAPQSEEHTALSLTVTGTLPPELSGRYLRNGHNPIPGVTPSHWFRGSGMLHGVRLREGRAEWYRSRWVRTPTFTDDAALTRDDGSVDLTASVAGTHVIGYGGRILALQEANLPFEVTPELDTVGPYDFGGRLRTAMTAHPRVDPATGHLHFFGYGPFPPHLTWYVATTAGEIVHEQVVDGAGTALMHDFGLTEHWAVWLDLPVVFTPSDTTGMPYRWSDGHRPRIGLTPRDSSGPTRWIDVEPGALLHVTNAYEQPDGTVVVEGPRYDRAAWETSWKWWIGAPGFPTQPVSGAASHRWVLDPATGSSQETGLDDLVTEFPTIDDGLSGSEHPVSYALAFPGAGLDGYAVVRYDRRAGTRSLLPAGPGRMPGEPVFVPAAAARDREEGYLLTMVSDLAGNCSDLEVLDAETLATIATVHLPVRVPSGIHGSWVPDA